MNDKTKKIVLASMLGALTFIATIIIRVPMPAVGYVNLGDCIVLLCGWILGPIYGAISAGLGSAIADLSAGYVVYAPATFVIKALMAVAAYYIGVKLAKSEKNFVLKLLSAIVAEIIMICGYFVYESFLGGIAMAAGNILFNSIQGVFGLIAGVVLINIYGKSGLKF
ncbi:MAG: ECF transporter S component [Ruminococcaceae bacterium]|nr:ECF transporter S component [Oscillospiraceae bacterium]